MESVAPERRVEKAAELLLAELNTTAE